MNIDFDHLEKIIALAERSNIQSLEVVDGSQRIHVVCQAASLANTAELAHSPTTHHVTNTQAQTQNIPAASSTATPSCDQDTAKSNDLATKTTVIAPMMGTFYLRPEPNAEVFVHVGDSIKAGDTLCVIEAMKIMHEVKAETDCVIEKILIKEGDVVEFDQPLFETRTL
ncbi:acetyl-CoA carboxylase biotin carboxyl carrier protein [Psychrobacter sp. H7-1]|uniref:acetyl-CoA carboxylase biotin carboxyl carrier protein n=1 Tax=Psychrobacter sp. H7-1 TaxID=1569265 RepID=UPI00191A7C79|nr:acetyl-CoA carboxylase biotin carboxyl carrier protein [Psychrobacter sp. H7-1]